MKKLLEIIGKILLIVLITVAIVLITLVAMIKMICSNISESAKELFATTMSNWASLAGFHGHKNKKGEITYAL